MKKYQIIIVSLILLCISVAPVLARAGGGESFGGGSFGGGTYGAPGGFFFLPLFFGGSGGGGSWVWFLIIFLFIFIIPAFLRKYGPNNSNNSFVYNHPIDSPIEASLAPIQEHDYAFNRDRFIDMCQTVFFDIENAWSTNDLTKVRALMTDSLYRRLNLQIQDFKRRGINNVLSEIAVADIKVVKVNSEGGYDSITAFIHASMVDTKVDSKGKTVEGNPRTATEFVEYWTFMRSSNVSTTKGLSLVTKTCPNCGAPLEVNENGLCKYCGADILTGDFDWVLSDISQSM